MSNLDSAIQIAGLEVRISELEDELSQYRPPASNATRDEIVKKAKIIAALFWGADQGDFELVIDTLEQRVDINRTDAEGNTPILIAAKKGHATVVQLLCDRGAQLTFDNGKSVESESTHLEIIRIVREAEWIRRLLTE
jgi:ankyrin repeat protein